MGWLQHKPSSFNLNNEINVYHPWRHDSYTEVITFRPCSTCFCCSKPMIQPTLDFRKDLPSSRGRPLAAVGILRFPRLCFATEIALTKKWLPQLPGRDGTCGCQVLDTHVGTIMAASMLDPSARKCWDIPTFSEFQNFVHTKYLDTMQWQKRYLTKNGTFSKRKRCKKSSGKNQVSRLHPKKCPASA